MRGQMEVMGLLVIVVLFIFGGLIYLFLTSGPGDSSLPEVRQSAEVANLLSAMMAMNPCDSTSDSFSDIVHSCFISGGNSAVCGVDCKPYIRSVVSNVTRAYNPSVQYSFTIKEQSGAVFVSEGSCNLTKRMASDTSVRAGNRVLRVGLVGCYR